MSSNLSPAQRWLIWNIDQLASATVLKRKGKQNNFPCCRWGARLETLKEEKHKGDGYLNQFAPRICLHLQSICRSAVMNSLLADGTRKLLELSPPEWASSEKGWVERERGGGHLADLGRKKWQACNLQVFRLDHWASKQALSVLFIYLACSLWWIQILCLYKLLHGPYY